MAQRPKPTAAELEILDVLWEKGRATVGDVQAAIGKKRPAAYTTVLKLMQIMLEKGLVRRSTRGKAHVYRAAEAQRQTQARLVSDLLDRAFRGSALGLVQQVLETKPASREELDEIRKLIADAESREARK